MNDTEGSISSSTTSPYVLLFSYGSNLGADQIRCRCPSACLIDQAFLSGYRWQINARGYANIVPAEGHEVHGLVHALTHEDIACMDLYEGVDHDVYSRHAVQVQISIPQSVAWQRIRSDIHHQSTSSCLDPGKHDPNPVVRCITYIDRNNNEGTPHEEYVHRINRGLIDSVLPHPYIHQIIRSYIPPLAPSHSIRIFVYGTLKRTGTNHHLLTKHQAIFEDEAQLYGAKLYHFGPYPGAVEVGATPEEFVRGEVFSADISILLELDALEEYEPNRPSESLYIRKPVWVQLMNEGSGAHAQVYFHNPNLLPSHAIHLSEGYFDPQSSTPE